MNCLNREILEPTARGKAPIANLPDKLRKWLRKLYESVLEIVRAIAAVTFSITVGTQMSVTMTFDNADN